MLILKHFTRYEFDGIEGGQYWQTEDGVDWYAAQALFQPDTMKIVFGDDGVIISANTDVTQLIPNNASVAEIPLADFPRSFTNSGEWYFLDGKIQVTAAAKEKRAKYVRDEFLYATDVMMVEDYSLNDEELTTEQRTELKAVRKEFRQWPSEHKWPDIALPEIPTWILEAIVKRGYTIRTWPPNY